MSPDEEWEISAFSADSPEQNLASALSVAVSNCYTLTEPYSKTALLNLNLQNKTFSGSLY